ncbi:putative dnaJ-like subfamily B member 14-like [Cocos nucifera]|nr:putative dnaJ-like subfamily B member 14-like [Cocos nucifera]
MDCDKEEAEKAKAKAEEMFKSNDIEGAKKMVLKAQRLYSSLPGLSQMLAAFNVHLAAAAKDRNGRTNCYVVLDVDPSDDIKTIKRRCKKLRFLTHPDKNRSAAADGAFKLVVQAWEFISSKASSSNGGSDGSARSGAGYQHDCSSGARPRSGSSTTRSDSKTGSEAKVACPKCRRNCKSLDSSELIIRCRYCNLFAARGRQDGDFDITIDGVGVEIHGGSNVKINVYRADDVSICGGTSIYVGQCDDVRIEGGDSVHINCCDGFHIIGSRNVNFG